MRKPLNIKIGETHNRLKVISQIKTNLFECLCSCGNICLATSVQLYHNKKKSCGCLKREAAKNLCIQRNTTHGLSKTKEYKRNQDRKNRIKFKDKIKERKKQYNKNLKLKTFKAYSKNGEIECCRCGEKDDRVLNLDHINGGGRKHSKNISNIYSYLNQRSFPPGFQVLCQNCNWIKLHENKEIKQNGKNTEVYKKSNLKLRAKLISAYSNEQNECKFCGNKDMRVLCLDHINGGGCLDRKKYKHDTAPYWWRHLIKNNFPPGIQVLCQNCNRRKMYENNEWGKRFQ